MAKEKKKVTRRKPSASIKRGSFSRKRMTKAELEEENGELLRKFIELDKRYNQVEQRNVSLHNQLVHEKKNHVEFLEKLALQNANRDSVQFKEPETIVWDDLEVPKPPKRLFSFADPTGDEKSFLQRLFNR